MKKLLLLLLTISYFSISSFAQQKWTKIYNESDVIVEMSTIECNPSDRMVPYTYVILKYTNKTNQIVDFKFEINKWYNGLVHIETVKDAGDFPIQKSIKLQPNQSVEGNCDSDLDILRVFGNNNNPKMHMELTKIEIKAI